MSKAENVLPKVILLGDSLTSFSFEDERGYGPVMEGRFKDKAEVISEGFAGYTTELIKPTFTSILSTLAKEPHPPLLFTIWLGANDSFLGPSCVPLAQYKANLRAFVHTLLNYKPTSSTRILLLSPPPLQPHRDPPVLSANDPVESRKQLIAWRVWCTKMEFADAVLALEEEFVAEGETRVAAVDVWRAVVNYGLQREGREVLASHEQLTREMAEERRLPGCDLPGSKRFPEGVFVDHVHLGSVGYDIVNAAVFERINEAWPDLL